MSKNCSARVRQKRRIHGSRDECAKWRTMLFYVEGPSLIFNLINTGRNSTLLSLSPEGISNFYQTINPTTFPRNNRAVHYASRAKITRGLMEPWSRPRVRNPVCFIILIRVYSKQLPAGRKPEGNGWFSSRGGLIEKGIITQVETG